MAKDEHSVHDGRSMGAKAGGKESIITKGGIETSVEGFMGNIMQSAPFRPTYGTHKKMGSEMAPVVNGGRSAKSFFRSKLMKGGR